MASSRYQVMYGCTFCGTCVLECPAQAVEMTARGARIDQARCTGCGRCMANCASEAIAAEPPSEQKPGGHKERGT